MRDHADAVRALPSSRWGSRWGPGWLGFVALTGWQLARAEFAVALIAAGMAAMAIGMAFPAGHLVHGPWWAAVIAIWAWRSASAAAPSAQLQHLVGGVAMVYMCAAWPGSAGLATPAASPL